MRLYIREGGDPRESNGIRGFNLTLESAGVQAVHLHSTVVRPITGGFSVSQSSRDSPFIPKAIDESRYYAMNCAFDLIKTEARNYQASYQIPLMFVDRIGKEEIIRNLDNFDLPI